jgi:hypothetical protein
MTLRYGNAILLTQPVTEERRKELSARLVENAEQCGYRNPKIIFERINELVSKCYWVAES